MPAETAIDEAFAPEESIEFSRDQAGPIVEIGWVVLDELDKPEALAVKQARDRLKSYLREALPQFNWKVPRITRPHVVRELAVEPVTLFDYGAGERDLRHWDYTILITSADLICHYKPYAFGAFSRALDVAVVSLARLNPKTENRFMSAEERIERLARRLLAVSLHIIGHLNGLEHHEDNANLMFNLDVVDDIDELEAFDDEQIERLEVALRGTADQRLEERREFEDARGLRFYLSAMWINRGDLFRAITQAKPWQFPLRLNRLTTAAMSSMVILLVTAEAWELGMSQPFWLLVLASIAAIAVTSTYVIRRQGLLVGRGAKLGGEQVVITNAAAVAIVSGGMVTTYVLLFAFSLLAGFAFFRVEMLEAWASSIPAPIGPTHYCALSAFISSLGILIGALGATFEQQQYFRHITYVDEEV